MKDHLLDLVQHTFDLGYIDLIKITGTDQITKINGLAEDKSVVVEGSYNNPVPEFIGTFGLPNLNKLKILLQLPEYKEDAKLTVTSKASGEPSGLDFVNAAGDFKNNYRFMESGVITAKLQSLKFKTPTWHVEFEPTVAGIQRLRMQAQANAEEPHFQIKTENNNLKLLFGDHSSHAGNFIFHSGVTGQLKRAWSYPITQVISILGLTGDKTVRISDDGAMQITVNSGLGVYNYILPAQTK